MDRDAEPPVVSGKTYITVIYQCPPALDKLNGPVRGNSS